MKTSFLNLAQISICLGIVVSATALVAQEVTPEATPETTEPRTLPFIEPFTQEDFTVLTANVQRPNGLGWLNNNIYAVCTGDRTVYEINDTTGQTMTLIGGITNAHTVIAEGTTSQLRLWVPDFAEDQLNLVTRGGRQVIVDNLNGPWGIAQLDDDRFMITNLRGDTVSVVSRDGNHDTYLTDLAAPTGIAVDGEYVYVANNGSTRRAIEWYYAPSPEAAELNEEVETHSLVSGIQNVTNIQMAADGLLYFAYSLGTRGVVGRADPVACRDGGCTPEDIQVVAFTDLPAPLAGLLVTPDMRLYVHAMFNPNLFWVQLDTTGLDIEIRE